LAPVISRHRLQLASDNAIGFVIGLE